MAAVLKGLFVLVYKSAQKVLQEHCAIILDYFKSSALGLSEGYMDVIECHSFCRRRSVVCQPDDSEDGHIK